MMHTILIISMILIVPTVFSLTELVEHFREKRNRDQSWNTQFQPDDPRYGRSPEWCRTYEVVLAGLDEGRDFEEDLLKHKIKELEPKPEPQNPAEWDAQQRAIMQRQMQGMQQDLRGLYNQLDSGMFSGTQPNLIAQLLGTVQQNGKH